MKNIDIVINPVNFPNQDVSDSVKASMEYGQQVAINTIRMV